MTSMAFVCGCCSTDCPRTHLANSAVQYSELWLSRKVCELNCQTNDVIFFKIKVISLTCDVKYYINLSRVDIFESISVAKYVWAVC
jgi:hypothetical protein